jgi:hypothetical protein
MRNILKGYYLILVIVHFNSSISYSQIIYATSCSNTDVQAAIDMANSGDTVLVPAGNATWTGQLEIRKGIILLGAGIGQTIIFRTENSMIHLTNYRSWTSCGGNSVDPDSCEEGYPCVDQLQELHIWNNTYNSVAFSATVDDRGLNTEHLQENRDYFHSQMPGYTPHTYPHPLVSDGTTSVEKLDNIKNVHILTNPVVESLDVIFSLEKPVAIEIIVYDINGKKCHTYCYDLNNSGGQSIKINAASLNPGIYFMHVLTEKESEVHKFIKQYLNLMFQN